MITVKEIDNGKFIHASVTDFSDSLGYCEHKIPFYLEGIKAPPSLETLQGTKAHDEEQKYEEEHFVFEPVTPEQLGDITKNLEFAREAMFTRYLTRMKIENDSITVLLSGRSDKIKRMKETLVVQDDKFPTNLQKYSERFEPYSDQILQALTYLNSSFSNDGSFNPEDWFEIPHKQKVWIIQIRDKYHENKIFKVFKGIQNDFAEKYLESNVKRFAKLVLGIEKRVHHNIPDKCKPCRYADKCEFKL